MRLALAAVLGLLACQSGPRVQTVDWEQWVELQAGGPEAPVSLIYVWASWSRPAIALLPSVLEFEGEYESDGVEFLFLCLDAPPESESHRPVERVLAELGAAFNHYRLEMSFDEASERLGVWEPPAAIVRARNGSERTLTGEGRANPLTPADIADALDEALRTDPMILGE